MLSQRALSFLNRHKRRLYAWDADFLSRLYRQAGFPCARPLVEFQHAFGGYVSPTTFGQWVWGLRTSIHPTVHHRHGEPVTACTLGVDDGPLIDSTGRLYRSDAESGPVVSSCSTLFEQMAFIWEWHDQAYRPDQSLRPASDCIDVDRFRRDVLPRMEHNHIPGVSDEYSQIYSSERFAILADANGATAWFRDSAEWLTDVFAAPVAKPNHQDRFANRVRTLFCDNARYILYW